MSEKVVRLIELAASPPSLVNDEVIQHLEMLVERAKAGRINGIVTAAILIDTNGRFIESATGWVGTVRDAVHSSLGTVDVLRERMLRELVEWG